MNIYITYNGFATAFEFQAIPLSADELITTLLNFRASAGTRMGDFSVRVSGAVELLVGDADTHATTIFPQEGMKRTICRDTHVRDKAGREQATFIPFARELACIRQPT